MNQYIYWHAPLWEVLAVLGGAFLVFVLLIVYTLRRPNLSTSLSTIDPGLSKQPFFFYSHLKGINALNEAAEHILQMLPNAKQDASLKILQDTLLEACTEGRVVEQHSWPETGMTLIAIPISSASEDVQGVLASVVKEPPTHPGTQLAEQVTPARPDEWLTLGAQLRVHRSRTIVRVKRPATPTPDGEIHAWQEHQLSYLEDRLLRHLLLHCRHVQPAETLFQMMWPDENTGQDGLRPEQNERLRRVVYQLRKRLEPDPRNPIYICTAHGIGYVLHTESEAYSVD